MNLGNLHFAVNNVSTWLISVVKFVTVSAGVSVVVATVAVAAGALDGTTAVAGAGAALYKDGILVSSAIHPLPAVRTNNVAEYEGLHAALGLLQDLPQQPHCTVHIVGDSQVVTRHMQLVAQPQDHLRPYFTQARRREAQLLPRFDIAYEHVRRESNATADALSNEAMDEVYRQLGPPEDFAAYAQRYVTSAHAKAQVVQKTG